MIERITLIKKFFRKHVVICDETNQLFTEFIWNFIAAQKLLHLCNKEFEVCDFLKISYNKKLNKSLKFAKPYSLYLIIEEIRTLKHIDLPNPIEISCCLHEKKKRKNFSL